MTLSSSPTTRNVAVPQFTLVTSFPSVGTYPSTRHLYVRPAPSFIQTIRSLRIGRFESRFLTENTSGPSRRAENPFPDHTSPVLGNVRSLYVPRLSFAHVSGPGALDLHPARRVSVSLAAMRVETRFAWLTFTSMMCLFVLVLWGAVDSPRPRAPSISAMISDDCFKALLYSFFVSIFVVSRTALVYAHTVKTKIDYMDTSILALGAVQISGLILVATFPLSRFPGFHYLSASCSVLCGLACEALLLVRRYKSGHYDPKPFLKPDYVLNVLVYVGCFVSLLAYGVATVVDYNAETVTYVGVAEWYGFLFMDLLTVFRVDDLLHATKCNRCGECDRCGCSMNHRSHKHDDERKTSGTRAWFMDSNETVRGSTRVRVPYARVVG